MRRGARALFLVAVTFVVTGCSTAEFIDPEQEWTSADIQERAEYMREQGNDFVADRFADGEVSADEYREGVDMFVTCMTDRGYTTTDPVVSPVDGLSIIVEPDPSGKSSDVYGADLEECRMYMGALEAMFPITHTQVMDEPLLVAVTACLTGKGEIVPEGARNYPEMQPADFEFDSPWKRAFDQCLVDNVFTLYPDLPGVPVYG